MLLVGLGFLTDWLLVSVLNVDFVKSLLVTGIVFVALGLVLGERPFKA